MPYVLRFVQRFRAADEAAFMALEAEFAALERRKGWPCGRRSRPYSGREPAHTLVWESELPTLAAVNDAVAAMGGDADHASLLKRQIPCFLEAWTEVYEVLEFPHVMSHHVDPRRLVEWCRVPADQLVGHPGLRVPFRVVEDAREMGRLMAQELVDLVAERNAERRPTRVIVPCGPTGWYEAWTELVNQRGVSLARLSVFHMDECLDWQGRPLPKNHPYNFRTFMERRFYGGIRAELNVPEAQRFWLLPETIERVREAIAEQPIDLTLGGWGQDGHVAYNQPRRHPLSHVSLEQLADSTIRVQENTADTILALAHRTFGAAYQFVPPMSVTLGIRECLAASRVRVFSDTGSWKQTALRVALFSEPVAEYPITLLQRHRDALITATRETARHPIAENPDWELL